MLRRKFLKTVSPIIALVTVQDLFAKTVPKSSDQISDELTHTVYLKKIGSNTITAEEKKLIKDLNLDFMKTGQLVSISNERCEINNELYTGFKTLYTFRSKSDKADYLNQKELLLKSFKNNKLESQS